MLGARAGNVALVEALLERGADPQIEDEFGHTPWWSALNRAMEDAEFARQSLASLFERIGPTVLDVQTNGRLVRLQHQQGEYWVLSLMLAGFKTQNTRCVERSQRAYKYLQGFFAEALFGTLECLPNHLWQRTRRKRSYVNSVLARAEVHSLYQPARQLWVRTRNGHYLPNPLMQLRVHGDHDGPGWRPVFDALNLPWVATGTTASDNSYRGLEGLVESAARRAARSMNALDEPSAPSAASAEDADLYF